MKIGKYDVRMFNEGEYLVIRRDKVERILSFYPGNLRHVDSLFLVPRFKVVA
jgi:hypothetical protein